jgi:hypothetical protein
VQPAPQGPLPGRRADQGRNIAEHPVERLVDLRRIDTRSDQFAANLIWMNMNGSGA